MTEYQAANILADIVSHVQQGLRNRVVLSCRCIDGIEYHDVGMALSRLLRRGCLPANAIQKMFSASANEAAGIGHYLAIRNISILFEPELKLDIRSLLDTHSKDQCLVIQSESERINDCITSLCPQTLIL